jgi:hypothetical protein
MDFSAERARIAPGYRQERHRRLRILRNPAQQIIEAPAPFSGLCLGLVQLPAQRHRLTPVFFLGSDGIAQIPF